MNATPHNHRGGTRETPHIAIGIFVAFLILIVLAIYFWPGLQQLVGQGGASTQIDPKSTVDRDGAQKS